MAGPFEFLHIKRRTEGSSNELSFDVLDAARTDIDSQKRREARTHVGPKPSQGSYHGVAGTSTLSAVPEVERRKKARRAHLVRAWAAVIAVIVLVTGVGAFVGFQLHQDKQDFNGQYNALIERMVESDQMLLRIDEVMEKPLETAEIAFDKNSQQAESPNSTSYEAKISSPKDIENLEERIPGFKRELNAVMAESQRLKEFASSDRNRAALSQLQSAVEARLEMIASAGESLDIVVEAGKRMAAAKGIWQIVLKADGIAREAAELANSAGTEEAIRAAKARTEEARDLFIEAKDNLSSLEIGRPELDYSSEKAYVEKRVESLSAAIKTSDALLTNNRDAASKANAEYNSADKEAVSLAVKLPSSETEKIKRAYSDQINKIYVTYDNNKVAAATADSAIRSYLDGR